ncbi:MAG: hypothetical protein ACPIA7_06505 [Akkermansiaceae bacterium]
MLPFELIATAIFSFVVGVLGVGLGRLRRSSSYTRDKKKGGGSLFRAVRSQLLVPLYVSASLIMALHVSIYYDIEKYWVAEDELWKLSGDTIAPSSFEEVVTRQLSDELDVLLKQIETDISFDPVTK